jgi:ectoine hydroxylase-related dioxygenase (phytanoyl-CoA dioxygenase family)
VIQGYHRDFENKSDTWKTHFPLSCIVAFQDKTKIHVVKSDFAEIRPTVKKEDLQGMEVELKKGEAIIFHPLLIHAGSEYKKLNIRSHAYLSADYKFVPVNYVAFAEEK